MAQDIPGSSRAAPETKIRGETLARMADVPLRRPGAGALPRPDTGGAAVPAAPSPIDGARAHVARLVFLAPDKTPSTAEIHRTVGATLRGRCLDALSLDQAAIDGAIAALNAALPASPPARRQSIEAMIATDQLADPDVHDLFFQIGRTGHAHPGVFLRSTLQTLVVLRTEIAEAPTTLNGDKLTAIRAALAATIAAALGSQAVSASPAWVVSTGPAVHDHAPRRWIRGHQIFAALTQGLIFAFNALHQAVEREQPEARAAAANLLADLMQACACALELTGDFLPTIYEEVIRPSMALPYQPKGFSGLLSADHCHLVRRMKATRPAMERLRDDDPARHAAVVAALAGVYDAHKFVCSRFVGTEKSSLLMRTEATRSSIEQLERFKAARLKQIA